MEIDVDADIEIEINKDADIWFRDRHGSGSRIAYQPRKSMSSVLAHLVLEGNLRFQPIR